MYVSLSYYEYSVQLIFTFFCLWRFDPITGHVSRYEGSRSHLLDTPHSVGLLWTRDRPVVETST